MTDTTTITEDYINRAVSTAIEPVSGKIPRWDICSEDRYKRGAVGQHIIKGTPFSVPMRQYHRSADTTPDNLEIELENLLLQLVNDFQQDFRPGQIRVWGLNLNTAVPGSHDVHEFIVRTVSFGPFMSVFVLATPEEKMWVSVELMMGHIE